MLLRKAEVQLVRKHIEDLSGYVPTTKDTTLKAMYDTIDGHGRKYITAKMATRYSRSLISTKNAEGESVQISVKTDAARLAAIQGGFIEVVSLYAFQRIVAELATLWTEGSKYVYEGDKQDNMSSLEVDRLLGGSDLAMARVDSLSVASTSAAVLIQVVDGTFNYIPLGRDRIHVVFADTIISNGEERAVVRTNIEEATCILLDMGEVETGGSRFAAYFGRGVRYPQGRLVQYVGKHIHEVPEVGSKEALDYTDSEGNVANPLTLWNATSQRSPEYPVVCWYGSTAGYGESLLPVSYDLYEQTREFDIAGSRLAMSALKSAKGVTFLGKSTQNAEDIMHEVIDEGPVIGGFGQTLTNVSNPASNSVSAWDVIQGEIAATANAYGVPSYLVAVKDSSSFPSGEALKIANEPLRRARHSRYVINRSNALRKFHVEAALASAEAGEDQALGVVEMWSPDERRWPTSVGESISNSKALIDAGLSTIEEEIKTMHGLTSLEAVEAWKAERGLTSKDTEEVTKDEGKELEGSK